MSKRRFIVKFNVTAMVLIDEEVLNVAKREEWMEHFYSLRDENDVIYLVASSLVQGRDASDIQGWEELEKGQSYAEEIGFEYVECEEVD